MSFSVGRFTARAVDITAAASAYIACSLESGSVHPARQKLTETPPAKGTLLVRPWREDRQEQPCPSEIPSTKAYPAPVKHRAVRFGHVTSSAIFRLVVPLAPLGKVRLKRRPGRSAAPSHSTGAGSSGAFPMSATAHRTARRSAVTRVVGWMAWCGPLVRSSQGESGRGSSL